jgi:hypothetical protein
MESSDPLTGLGTLAILPVRSRATCVPELSIAVISVALLCFRSYSSSPTPVPLFCPDVDQLPVGS